MNSFVDDGLLCIKLIGSVAEECSDKKIEDKGRISGGFKENFAL